MVWLQCLARVCGAGSDQQCLLLLLPRAITGSHQDKLFILVDT